LNFTTDGTIVSYSDDPATATLIKAAHITELRTAINAVRSLAGQSSATWTHAGLATGDLIYADDVRDLRTALNSALVTLNIDVSNYTDNTITSYADDPLTATVFKAVHLRELRTRSTSGTGNSTSGGSTAGLTYVLSDLQELDQRILESELLSTGGTPVDDEVPGLSLAEILEIGTRLAWDKAKTSALCDILIDQAALSTDISRILDENGMTRLVRTFAPAGEVVSEMVRRYTTQWGLPHGS